MCANDEDVVRGGRRRKQSSARYSGHARRGNTVGVRLPYLVFFPLRIRRRGHFLRDFRICNYRNAHARVRSDRTYRSQGILRQTRKTAPSTPHHHADTCCDPCRGPADPLSSAAEHRENSRRGSGLPGERRALQIHRRLLWSGGNGQSAPPHLVAFRRRTILPGPARSAHGSRGNFESVRTLAADELAEGMPIGAGSVHLVLSVLDRWHLCCWCSAA